jgi:hypothetical protein
MLQLLKFPCTPRQWSLGSRCADTTTCSTKAPSGETLTTQDCAPEDRVIVGTPDQLHDALA